MEVERQNDTHWHFALGPVERWVVGLSATALVTLLGWLAMTFRAQLDSQGRTQQHILTEQAITNTQLIELNRQLTGIPDLSRQMAELQVQVKRNAQDIHDLQNHRSP